MCRLPRTLDKRVILALHFVRKYPKEAELYLLGVSDPKGYRQWNRRILERIAELPEVCGTGCCNCGFLTDMNSLHRGFDSGSAVHKRC